MIINLANVLKALYVFRFDVLSFEAKNGMFEFDRQFMNVFEFVQCLKNKVATCSIFDKMVFDPLLFFEFHTWSFVVDPNKIILHRKLFSKDSPKSWNFT